MKALVKKRFLPNYGVFDEMRYFAPGNELFLFEHGETLIGVTVCEDMWQPGPPATDLALAGAQLLVNISASPFHLLRDREREEMFRTRARDTAAFVAFCNTVGGQDELIFDGHSLVIDDEGTVIARAPGFEEALLVVDVDPSSVVQRRLTDARRRALAAGSRRFGPVTTIHVGAPHEQTDTLQPSLSPFCDDLEQMRLALELGLRDYVRKNGFTRDRRRRLRRHRLGARRGARRRRRSAPSACTASRCRRATRPRGRAATRSGSPRISAATSARSRSSRSSSS